jgi:hypothetical protein
LEEEMKVYYRQNWRNRECYNGNQVISLPGMNQSSVFIRLLRTADFSTETDPDKQGKIGNYHRIL